MSNEVVTMSQGDQLVALAIEQGADIDKLEKLIELRNREEERIARLAFDTHFGEMQSEFTAVVKSKEAKDYDDNVMYVYAPLETLQVHYNPTIFNHGFSYRWREEAIETGKRCVLCISGHGHITETSFDIPKIPSNKRMNDVQAAGSMSTYGRRYTFIAGFGIIIAGEDDDAASAGDNRTVAEVRTERELPDLDQGRVEINKLIERYEPVVNPAIIKAARFDMDAAKDINTMRRIYQSLKGQCESVEAGHDRIQSRESAKKAGAVLVADHPDVTDSTGSTDPYIEEADTEGPGLF